MGVPRPASQKKEAMDGIAQGMTRTEVASLTGIPIGTIARWQHELKYGARHQNKEASPPATPVVTRLEQFRSLPNRW